MYIQMDNNIIMETLNNGEYKLISPFVFIYKQTYTIPKKFIWDGGSIPTIAKSFVGGAMQSNHRRAYLIHDYFYSEQNIKRKEADKILRHILKQCNVNFLTRNMIYYAIRLFGKNNYIKSKNQ